MRVSVILLTLCTIATYTGDISAQEIGSRVRVRNTSGTLATGTLVRLDNAAVVVRVSVLNSRAEFVDRDSTIPVTVDTRLDMSMGRRSHGGKGALIGLGVGMGITALILASAENFDVSRALTRSTLVFGGGGALIGYLIGSGDKFEKWVEVRLDLPPKGDPNEVTEGMVRLGLRINL